MSSPKTNKKIANLRLIIFILAFAAIGGFLVIRSFASTSYPMSLTASPTSVSPGGNTTLSWSISGYSNQAGMACSLTDTNHSYTFTGPISGGRYRSPGSASVSNLQQTDTFNMHCANQCND